MIDLKQAFWSIRDHSTNLASGLSCLMAIIHSTRLIPVAMGATKHPAEVFTPKNPSFMLEGLSKYKITCTNKIKKCILGVVDLSPKFTE